MSHLHARKSIHECGTERKVVAATRSITDSTKDLNALLLSNPFRGFRPAARLQIAQALSVLLQDLPKKTRHKLLKSITWAEVEGAVPIEHWLRRFLARVVARFRI